MHQVSDQFEHHLSHVGVSLMQGNADQIVMLREQYRCPHFRILIIDGLMQARQPSLRKFVGYNKEQSLSYMTRMVCKLSC
jgi:hypothetical protein